MVDTKSAPSGILVKKMLKVKAPPHHRPSNGSILSDHNVNWDWPYWFIWAKGWQKLALGHTSKETRQHIKGGCAQYTRQSW